MALATVAVGLYLVRVAGEPLGLPWAPFAGNWRPQVDPLVVVSVAVWFAPRLLDVPAGHHHRRAGHGLAGSPLASGLTNFRRWGRVLTEGSFEGPNEYLPALGALDYGAARQPLSPSSSPRYPVHAAGHPPGLLLVLHALGIDLAGRDGGASIIVAGALAVPLAYAVGREVLDERRARLAALLLAHPARCSSAPPPPMPSTSRSACSRPGRSRPGGGCSAVWRWPQGSFFAWSLLAVAWR